MNRAAHAIFLLLHLAALLAAWPLAFITVPAHLLFLLIQSRSARPTPDTHVICPACRELVRRDARLCRHCRTPLIPQ